MTCIAIDISGLAWSYRTGVQNLYWAFAQAYARQPNLAECEILFYDRSGAFNSELGGLLGSRYHSLAPRWWPGVFRRPFQSLIRVGAVPGPALKNVVNHVWNWNIYNPKGARGSITIPDVLPLEFPQWFSSRFRRQTETSLQFAKKDAEFVFCISGYIKERVMEMTGIDGGKIRVVYPGIDPGYFVEPDPEVKQAVLRKHGLESQGFLLSSGFLDPRKNLRRQIEAFGVFAQRTNTELKYALTGLKTSLSTDVLSLIEQPHLRDRVHFLGYVPAGDLTILMGSAAVLMYCSIAEGFGLPIIEAMAAGSPVLTSRTTSMRELAEGRGFLVDPEDVGSIADGLEKTLFRSSLDTENVIRANKEYARDFTIDRWLQGHVQAMRGPAVFGNVVAHANEQRGAV